MTDTAVHPRPPRSSSGSRASRGARRGRQRRRGGAVPRGQLLARPRLVHLEHQDHRGPDGRQRHARRHARAHEAARLGHDRAARPRPTASTEALDRVRDRGRAAATATSGSRTAWLDAADHPRRAQGPRGAEAARAARWAPSTAPTRTARPGWRSASAEARGARLRDPALRRDHRRRPGRDRARRAAAPARRADDHRRAQRAARATRGASATSRSACTTRSGTTTCPTSSSRRTGRSSRRRTRSATGSRCTRR